MLDPKHKMPLKHLLIPKVLVASSAVQNTQRAALDRFRPRGRNLNRLALYAGLLIVVWQAVHAAMLCIRMPSFREATFLRI